MGRFTPMWHSLYGCIHPYVLPTNRSAEHSPSPQNTMAASSSLSYRADLTDANAPAGSSQDASSGSASSSAMPAESIGTAPNELTYFFGPAELLIDRAFTTGAASGTIAQAVADDQVGAIV